MTFFGYCVVSWDIWYEVIGPRLWLCCMANYPTKLSIDMTKISIIVLLNLRAFFLLNFEFLREISSNQLKFD